ncbi:tachylectin-related carbohydrate-binding protein [Streptomyces sp. NPDC002057]|uniref:tachylectin-related carbohydrate-binding protein n=1 Tax=Streptomyces sp. NPDC002057 TaxID=3154664 RepID=UPI0033200721
MRHLRRALAATGVALAVVVPAAAGSVTAAPSPAPAAPGTASPAAPGTIVQEGGPLAVPSGEEGPVTTRLTVSLPPGVTGPLRGERVTFRAEPGMPGARPGEMVTSTCAVNGGAFRSCPWGSPDPETVQGTWLVLDLPPAEVPAGSSTVTYDITVDVPSGLERLGRLSSTVELRHGTGTVAASGPLTFDFVRGTPEASRRASLHARDRDGVLWQYDATGRTDTLLKARKRVGGGWGVYTAITELERTTAAGAGNLAARDRDGVLWFHRGRGPVSSGPFEPRRRVGGGWNAYTSIVGMPDGSLLARDRDGVLWRYPRTSMADHPFGSRVRVGGGWNAYTSIVAFGDGLVARTADGGLWRYERAEGGEPAVPFAPRRAVGGGWNAFTALAGAGPVGGHDTSLAARTGDGRLVVYGVVRWGDRNRYSEPYHPRPAGWGWNIYDLIV